MNLALAFVRVRRFAPDEERLVLSKQIVKFSFIYGVSRDLLYACLHINHQFSLFIVNFENFLTFEYF